MDSYLNKICTLEEATKRFDGLKQSGQKTVFTNGCFDILHPGHARYLNAARAMGDFLLVAVNSDVSVRALKGPKRPIFPENMRAELLAALACVDAVLIFNEENPLRVITHLLPHVLVKGGDWAEDEIIGADVVKSSGGQVCRIPFVSGHSTTDIINRILERYK